MPKIKQQLLIFDDIVDNVFIPANTEGDICSKDERLLLSFPVKKIGLAVPIFSNAAQFEFTNFRMATEQLMIKIKNQDSTSPVDGELYRISRMNIIKAREDRDNKILQQVREKMNPEELRANDLSRIKGASSWMTMLPLKSEKFLLNRENSLMHLALDLV